MFNVSINYILAFLPIIVLLVLALWRGLRTGTVVSFALTSSLFIYWTKSFSQYGASLISSIGPTLAVLMIIIGAIFLFNVLKEAGYIDQIDASLEKIHPAREVRFFMAAFGLTALFEGVAGFGTPAALVPTILIAMGFRPLLSIVAVLLIDGLAVTHGAVGTPVFFGFASVLNLNYSDGLAISYLAGLLNTIASIITMLALWYFYQKYENKIVHKKEVISVYCFFIIFFLIFSKYLPELATILAAVFMVAGVVWWLKIPVSSIRLKAWWPYGLLIIILMFFKFWPGVDKLLNITIDYGRLFNTDIAFHWQPFKSPFWSFIIVAGAVSFFHKIPQQVIKSTIKQSSRVVALLFLIIALAGLMLNSGGRLPAMVFYIAEAFSLAGSVGYLLAVPWLGLIGSFVSGSNTLSNVIFGEVHLQTASLLHLNQNLVLGLQSTGGALGNAICLFNIIAATSIVQLKEHDDIIKINLWPTVLAVLVVSITGLVYSYFI